MGVLDIIPGVTTSKIIGGTVAGSVGGYLLAKLSSKQKLEQEKEQRALIEKQNEELIQRIKEMDHEKEERALLRVSILRHIAWEDGELLDAEKLYIINFIINSPDISDFMKIEAIKEIDIQPSTIKKIFDNYFSFFKTIELFKTREEYEGFKEILHQIAYADGTFCSKEEEFIKNILKKSEFYTAY
ncbi:TerB family tellurite resistance protein [Terasakiella pusilla]|uniref:tellurite resistance TerB family protein n=1 Tax=Terasakiella pusilla TaxID=64973 RepID=UPI003AA86854